MSKQPRANHRKIGMSQFGVAAIEFALLLTLMTLLLGGVAVYWHALQVQQSLSRATGDGARMLQQLSQGENAEFNPMTSAGRLAIEQQVALTVKHSLKGTGLPLASNMTVTVGWGNGRATIQVVYPYDIWGSAFSWILMPRNLQAKSVVAIAALP